MNSRNALQPFEELFDHGHLPLPELSSKNPAGDNTSLAALAHRLLACRFAHEHEENSALNLMYDAVIPDPDPMKGGALEFLDDGRVGIGPECFGTDIDASGQLPRQVFRRPECSGAELDAVGRHRLRPSRPLTSARGMCGPYPLSVVRASAMQSGFLEPGAGKMSKPPTTL
jgi:hypothetical protein